MIVDDRCVGCGRCHPYCPAEAIQYIGRKSVIDEDRCLECGTCLRSGVCPVDAIGGSPFVFDYARSVRKFFSDPTTPMSRPKSRGGARKR